MSEQCCMTCASERRPWCKCDWECQKQEAKPEAPKWLDKPDGAGHWWRSRGGLVMSVHTLTETEAAEVSIYGPLKGSKWARITDVPAPPVVLPKERTVTLTATIKRYPEAYDGKTFCVDIDVGDYQLETETFRTLEQAITFARDYGIEPEVEES